MILILVHTAFLRISLMEFFRYFGCGLVIPEHVEGAKILDLGSGSGRDCFAVAKLVGETGHVTGLDMTPEQVSSLDPFPNHLDPIPVVTQTSEPDEATEETDFFNEDDQLMHCASFHSRDGESEERKPKSDSVTSKADSVTSGFSQYDLSHEAFQNSKETPVTM